MAFWFHASESVGIVALCSTLYIIPPKKSMAAGDVVALANRRFLSIRILQISLDSYGVAQRKLFRPENKGNYLLSHVPLVIQNEAQYPVTTISHGAVLNRFASGPPVAL